MTDAENIEGFVPFSLKGSYNNLYCDNLDETTPTNNAGKSSFDDETPSSENQMKNMLENVYCNAMPLSPSTANFEMSDFKATDPELHVYSNIKSSVSPDDVPFNSNAMKLPINYSTTTLMSNSLDLDLDDPTEIDRTTVSASKNPNATSMKFSASGDDRNNEVNVSIAPKKVKLNGTRKSIVNEEKSLKSLHDNTMIDTALDLDSIN